MLIFVLTTFLLVSKLEFKYKSLAFFLTLLYSLSIFSGVLLGFSYTIDSFFSFLNFVYLSFCLCLFIFPWTYYHLKLHVGFSNEFKMRYLSYFLILLNLINFIVLVKISHYTFTNVTDYSAFKNSGDNASFFREMPVNHFLHLISIYTSITSYFLIPFHFYYLIKGKLFLSIVSIVLSFNSVIEGFTIFSRSSFVLYIFMYFFFLLLFYNSLISRHRKVIKIFSFVFFSLIVLGFIIISNNRFTDYFMYGDAKYSKSIIRNPVIYSVLDYFSQWYKNSSIVMSKYNFETFDGRMSSPLLMLLCEKIGIVHNAENNLLLDIYTKWGANWDRFNGLIANFVFDFGYAVTLFISILYSSIVFMLKPKNNIIKFENIIVLSPLFALISMGIFNAYSKAINFHLFLIYSILLMLYLKSKVIVKFVSNFVIKLK